MKVVAMVKLFIWFIDSLIEFVQLSKMAYCAHQNLGSSLHPPKNTKEENIFFQCSAGQFIRLNPSLHNFGPIQSCLDLWVNMLQMFPNLALNPMERLATIPIDL